MPHPESLKIPNSVGSPSRATPLRPATSVEENEAQLKNLAPRMFRLKTGARGGLDVTKILSE